VILVTSYEQSGRRQDPKMITDVFPKGGGEEEECVYVCTHVIKIKTLLNI
jgi:hypothetical protein